MKHILLIVLFLSVGFSQQEYNSNDLIEMDNGLFTVKFSDEPITGKVYGNFGKEGEELTKVYIGKLINGEKDGKWTEWYENGQKSGEGTFKDGKQIGKTKWY
jgi:antitoxin component YwqK of YwqJK toxin-antitoxin module